MIKQRMPQLIAAFFIHFFQPFTLHSFLKSIEVNGQIHGALVKLEEI